MAKVWRCLSKLFLISVNRTLNNARIVAGGKFANILAFFTVLYWR